LQAKQNQFLKDYLSRYRIIDASISGVGDKLKARLRKSSIITASDIEYWRVTSVEGIGSNKGRALVHWRDSLIARARAQMPSSLSQSEIASIKQKYSSQKLQSETQRDDTQRRLAAQENTIRDQYTPKRKTLDTEQLAAQSKLAQTLQAITSRYTQEYTSLSQELAQLSAELKNESQSIDEDVSRLQKQMFDCHWQLAKTRRELRAFENVSFRHYLCLVLLGRYAGLIGTWKK
jgi:hypothetical protein